MQSHAKELPQILPGIGDIAGFYEGYILDLWGVLHNGIAPSITARRAVSGYDPHIAGNAPQ